MRSMVRVSFVTMGLLWVGCAGPKSQPAAPPSGAVVASPPSGGEPAPSDSGAPAAAASGGDGVNAAAAATPAPQPIKDVLGAVHTVEVREVDPGTGDVKSVRTYTAAADISAITKAIGADQTPNGPKPTCLEKYEVAFKDDAGVDKGVLGFCGGLGAKDQIESADFGPSGGDRAGIQVADAKALKKALAKKPPTKPKKQAAPTPKPAAGAKKKKP